jgi:hypothetical protein
MPSRIALPIRVGPNGSLATVEQDSPEDKQQCVAVILRTRVGDRWDFPGMGITPPEFDEDIDAAKLADQVNKYEVRAAADVEVDVADMVAAITVKWRDSNG